MAAVAVVIAMHEIPKLAAVTIHVSPHAAPGIDHHQVLEHHQDVP